MTLVSILGDFDSSILPVFYELKDQIKTHILVYDKHLKDISKARNILEGLEQFRKKYDMQFKIASYKIDEDSKQSIESLEKVLLTHSQNYEDITINITDGHATINTLLSINLISKGVKFIAYDRYENHANLISKDDTKTFSLSKSIPIKDHFLLRNSEVKYENNKQHIIDNKNKIKSLFQEHKDSFLILRKNPYETIPMKDERKVVKIVDELIDVFQPDDNTKFLQGTLYELYVAILLLDTDIDDFEVGVTIFTSEKPVYNEFDILIMKDNHLHTIECKMAKPDLNGLLYKYLAIKEQLDDESKIAIFSRHDNYFRKVKNKADTESIPKKRALVNKILLRGYVFDNEDKFYADMQEFFGLGMKKPC